MLFIKMTRNLVAIDQIARIEVNPFRLTGGEQGVLVFHLKDGTELDCRLKGGEQDARVVFTEIIDLMSINGQNIYEMPRKAMHDVPASSVAIDEEGD